ncbi:MAG: protoporphyrinogen oxidase HemJ [Alphaproteobacteria bacterium]|nr:protoporphyrinogen oxidase HemJ [Alphaproteobacteria bacterium]
MNVLAPYYPWLKALHILSVIAWMAGMLYLPRLFVYHAGTEPGSPTSETFKTMERRLYRAIMTPAMVATWFFGLSLTLTGVVQWTEFWLYAKLVLVAGMTWLHFGLGRWRRDFAADRRPHGAAFYRAINEAPTLLLIGIVVLAVVRPF